MKNIGLIATTICLIISLTACSGAREQDTGEMGSNADTGHTSAVNGENRSQKLKGIKNLTCVAQLTGKDSINKTDKYGVYGTDLGSMIKMDDKIYMIFGDTFGLRSDDQVGAGGENWRSNVGAVITDKEASDGLTFENMLVDEMGTAKELLGSVKLDNDEMTVIPTGGFSANNNLYLNFMSVRHWGAPGEWEANYGGLAVSKDKGVSWTKLEHMQWPGSSNFIQVAAYEIDNDIYFWCIPAGRFGGVRLMKADRHNVEDLSKYSYFTGEKDGKAEWSSNMDAATEIVPAPVGELSIMWNEYLGRWIMTYLHEKSKAIEIRESPQPWGPWGKPLTLVSANDYPALYGAYMHPEHVEQKGKIIYFAMSQWNPYNVFWMRAELVKEE